MSSSDKLAPGQISDLDSGTSAKPAAAELPGRTIGPDDVLGHMRVEDGLYVLGCFERRVTFASQQVRALNLVYALHERRVVPEGGAILVVGGGLAGMTAAAGAARLGHAVTLLEQRDELLPLPRGNTKRWIHPRVYDWPEGGAEVAEANIPLLPWKAACAGAVVEQIEAAWKAFPEHDRIEVQLGAKVTRLGQGSPRRVSWNAPGLKHREFAAVILAVGFGLERQIKGVDFVSYWDDDNLDQGPRKTPARYLVSGTGDGGLIDAVRARLRDFRHDRILEDFVGSPALAPVNQRLLDIEEQARGRERSRAGSARDYLHDQYEKLSRDHEGALATSIDAAIRSRLRKDVTVVLNGMDAVPFSLGASALSRFLVSRLIFGFDLEYRSGEFAKPRKVKDGYKVQFPTGEPETFHRIICRHGPDPALAKGFREVWNKHEATMRARALLDQTRWPIYGNAFARAPRTVGGGSTASAKTEPGQAPAAVPFTPSVVPARGAAGPSPDLPAHLATGFVGRDDLLVALREALHGTGQAALHGAPVLPGHVAAHGGGGIGKTRLAFEYARRHRTEYPGGIFHTVAGTRDPVALWAELARERPAFFPGDLTRDEDAAAAFAAWLADPSPGLRLLLLDDVQAPGSRDLFERFHRAYSVGGRVVWPVPAAGVHVLFTTREPAIPGARPIEVAALDRESALTLLLQGAGRAAPRSTSEMDAASDLAERVLGGHPLALSLAGAFLREVGPGYSFSEYRAKITEDGLIASLEEAAEHAGYRILDHERSIVATFELSRSKLDPAQPRDVLAWRILKLAACLAPNVAIDRRLIGRLLGDEGEPVKKEQVGLGTERLLGLSLLGPSSEGAEEGDVVIHPLVAEYTRWSVCKEAGDHEWERVQGAVIDAVNELLPDTSGDFWKISRRDACAGWEWLSPAREAHAVAAWSAFVQIFTPARRRLGTALGDVHVARGESSRALELHREAQVLAERLAAQDPSNAEWQRDLSVSHNRVGDVLRDQGDQAGALAEYKKAMAIAERLAAQDPSNAGWQRDLSISHNKVGDVLRDQGDQAGALAEFKKAMAIAERLAAQDPSNAGWQRDLSVSHNQVGDVLRAQGDQAGALAEFKKAMAIRECLAAQDPSNAEWQRDLSISHNKVGDVLRDQGDQAGALAEFKKAMATRERLTAQDPSNAEWQRDLSVSHERVGYVLRDQGDQAGALAEFKKAMATRERLAAQDPTNAGWQAALAFSCMTVASVLDTRSPGGLVEARALLQRGRSLLMPLAAASRLTHAQNSWLATIERRLQLLPSEAEVSTARPPKGRGGKGGKK